MSNPISIENALTGSAGWNLTNNDGTHIAAYTDKTSYNAGDTVSFYASVQTVQAYTLTIYRLGWYGGTGGCLKATINNTGVAQGWYNAGSSALTACPTAFGNTTTGAWEAGLAVTETWAIPVGAVTGIYVAVYTLASTKQAATYFVVKGNTSAQYVYITPFLTDQAYNEWGSGTSLYTNITVGYTVNFNRPYHAGYGCMSLYQHQVQFIHWAESQGYNLSYVSDIDVHANAAQLTTYKCMIFAAHMEYWTKAMYDGVQSALTAGVNICNTGANNCFWQCRLGPDNASNPNRAVICYKVQTANANLALDPLYGVTNTLVTTQWRDALLNRPEAALWGVMWLGDVNWPGNNVAWIVANGAPTSLVAGTGLVAGTAYGTDCVGYEYDKVWPAISPSNVQVIATTPITSNASKHDIAQTTMYTASSGALVFSSGAVDFAYALDGFRYNASSVATVSQMQTFMSNVMAALAKAPLKGSVFSMVGV